MPLKGKVELGKPVIGHYMLRSPLMIEKHLLETVNK